MWRKLLLIHLTKCLLSSHLFDVISLLAATHQQLFNDTLLKINKDLAYLQFELRACINQYDGMVYYGVVNNIADEESKLGTKYSVPQIAFYKGLVRDTSPCIPQSDTAYVVLNLRTYGDVSMWLMITVAARSNSSGSWKWWEHNQYRRPQCPAW